MQAQRRRLSSIILIQAFLIQALLLVLSLLAQNAHANEPSVRELQATISDKKASQAAMQQRLNEIDQQLKKTRSDRLDYDLEKKKQERSIRKIQVLSDGNTDTTALKKAQYKLKIANMGLEKTQRQQQQLQQEQAELQSRIGRITKVVARLSRDIEKAELRAKADQANKAQQLKQQKLKAQQLQAKKAAQQKQQQALAAQQKARQQAAVLAQQQAQQKALEQQQRADAKAAAIAAEAEQQRLLAMNANLSPAEAAINTAKVIANKPMQGPPIFGQSPELKLSNPVKSSAKTIAVLQHLGNHQYMTNIRLKKGRQNFYVGDKTFFKFVASGFQGKNAVFLIDGRNAEQPLMQIFIR